MSGFARATKAASRRVLETLRELFGGEPALILLDELSVYLRKVRNLEDARDQTTAFLTSLFKAVESAPNAVLVYTLAIGKDGRATDAYNAENPVHRRQYGGSGERFRAQGDAFEPHRRRRDGSSAPPPVVRVHR